jgi:hypothetical protein
MTKDELLTLVASFKEAVAEANSEFAGEADWRREESAESALRKGIDELFAERPAHEPMADLTETHDLIAQGTWKPKDEPTRKPGETVVIPGCICHMDPWCKVHGDPDLSSDEPGESVRPYLSGTGAETAKITQIWPEPANEPAVTKFGVGSLGNTYEEVFTDLVCILCGGKQSQHNVAMYKGKPFAECPHMPSENR